MTLPRYPYAVGQVVSGHGCDGKPFSGTVTQLVGPYNVLVDGNTYTPISLIEHPPLPSPADNDVFG